MKFGMRCRWCITLLFVCCFAVESVGAQTGAPETLFAANQFTQARGAYLRAIAESPQEVSNHVGLLRTLIRLDAWQEALREATADVTQFPASPDVHGMLCLCLMRAGKPETAQGEAQQALQLDPHSYWALVATGKMEVWDQHLVAARATLHQATALHPDWPEAWKALVDASSDSVTEENLADTVTYAALAPKGHPHDLTLETLPTRIKFIRNFLHDQPYHAVAPTTEEKLDAADRGEGHDFVFSTPIERKGASVILLVQVDQEKFKVLFDTGGGFELTLDRKATERLNLPLLYRSIVRGVSGKEGSSLYKATSLQVGEQVFQAIPVEGIANEVGPFDGIFGVTNFDHYAVTIDFQNNKLILARGKTATAPPAEPGNRLLTVPFHYSGGDIFVPLTVEGRHTWAIVDTGADAYAILSLRLAREIAATRNKGTYNEVKVKGRMGIGTSDMQQTVLGFTDPVGIEIGNGANLPFHGVINQAYGASPLDMQVSPASDFEVGAILGIEFLASARRMTIDYPHRVLTLEFPDSRPAAISTR